MKRISLFPALLLGISLSACGMGDWLGDKPERPPLPGERISVLDYEKDLRPEEAAMDAASFDTGEAWQNGAWPQAGGDPGHVMNHLALSAQQPQKIWNVSIGQGARKNLPLTAQPVLIGKTIFTLDTDAKLSAFDSDTGKMRWKIDAADPDEEDEVISGGIAADNGVIFVTAGYDEILAVDGQKGDIKWRAKLPAPSRAAPTIVDGRVFVTTLGNSVLALNANDGKTLWEFSGIGQSTGLVGAASPAATADMVIPAFSSGEIYALRSNNGSVAWSDNLAGTLKLGGMSALADIRGLPLVDNDVVYAISFGGKTAAIDLRTGARVWQKDIGGSKTPWIAGNRVFVISSDNQIISLDKQTGSVIWVSQLARFKDKEKRSGPIVWTGPVYAGGRLLAFSTEGRVAEINPTQGTLIREWSNNGEISIAPIVANGTLYILSNDGDLTAYR